MTGQRTDGAPVTLPKTFWRKLLGCLTAVFMIVSFSLVVMAESAAAGVPGSGYVTIMPAQCGVTVVGNNIVPNSDPAVFSLLDKVTNQSQAGPTGAKFKVPASLFIPRSAGPYSYIALGSNGYAQPFTGTVSCSTTTVPGKGHVESRISCTGKAGVDLMAINDTPNSSAISFTLWDDVRKLDLSFLFNDVQYGVPAFFHQTMLLGDQYNYIVHGPDGYKATFAGTLCPPPAPTEVTPNEPTFHDVDGTVNDTYTIVPTPGVVYSVNGSPITGTKPGVGTVTVTAEAAPGCNCILVNYKPWTYKFTDNNLIVPVAPAQPIYNDVDKSYTIPFTYVDCFVYHAPRSNETLTPGKLYEHGPGEVFIDATLKDGSGCVLKEGTGATTHFQHTFPADQIPPTTTQPAPPSTTVLPSPTTTVPPASTSTVPVPLKGNNPPPAQPPTKVTPPVVGNVPVPQPPAVVQVPAVPVNGLNPGFNAETGWDDVVVAPSAPHRFDYRFWAGVCAVITLALGVGAIFSARKSGEESA